MPQFDERLRSQIHKRGMSYTESAKQIGISRNTLMAALEGKPVTHRVARDILKWLADTKPLEHAELVQ